MPQILIPVGAWLPDSTAAPVWIHNIGRPYWAFDSGSYEYLICGFELPADYSAGTDPDLDLGWSGSSANTNSAYWNVEVMAVTPETDSVDTSSPSYDTANAGNDANLGTTAKRPQTLTIPLSNMDGAVAGDWVWFKLSRDAPNPSDDLAEDALLWMTTFSYTAS